MSTMRDAPSAVFITTRPGWSGRTSPMMAASSAVAVAAASCPGPRRRPRGAPGPPACPRWPRRADRSPASRRPRAPPSRTGTFSSSILMPTFDCAAISFSVVARPPRVGSRMAWIRVLASIISATRPFSGAQSLSSCVEKPRPSRWLSTAMPWSPIVPLRMTLSPGRAFAPEMSVPSGSGADARRVDEQPVGAAPVHHLGVPGDDPDPGLARRPPCIETSTRSRSSSGRPSSMMKARLR